MRPYLMENLELSTIGQPTDYVDYGAPKISSQFEQRILKAHRIASANAPAFNSSLANTLYRIGASATARNYLSTFLEAPPVLKATSLQPTTGKAPRWISLPSQKDAFIFQAALSGRVAFWYWYVRGNGMDVTAWLLKDFLTAFHVLPADVSQHLAAIGQHIHLQRFESLQFKLNAGKYVGSLNYQGLSPITSRADLLLLSSMDICKSDAQAILEKISRVLSINESAGERSIPDSVRIAVRKHYDVPSSVTPLETGEIDQYLKDVYGADVTAFFT